MKLLRPAAILLALFLFVQGTYAQESEKIKGAIIVKMLDLDYRFAMIPVFKDSSCRMLYANQSKAELNEFKQLLEPNLALFKSTQQTKLTNFEKAFEEILLTESVFRSLCKSVEGNDPAKSLSDKQHSMTRSIMTNDLENPLNVDLSLTLANVAVILNSPNIACRTIIPNANDLLQKYYKLGQATNKVDINIQIEQLMAAISSYSPEVPDRIAHLYESGFLTLSPAGKLTIKAKKEEFKKKEIKLKMLYPATKVYLAGKIRPLYEGEKYTINYPAIAEDKYNKSHVFFNTDGKAAKKKDSADYTFNIITGNINSLTVDPPIFVDGTVKANTMFQPDVSMRGYVVKIHYHYPVKIEVRNKAGELEKTIVVIDEHQELTDLFHMDFLREPRFEEESSVTAINPFISAEAAAVSSKEAIGLIKQRLEVNRWAFVTQAITMALSNSYGNFKVPNQTYAIYGIKDAQPEYTDLVALTEKTKDAISDLGEKEKTDASIEILKTAVADYEQRLKGDLTPNMRALCLINASQAALLTDDIEKSVSLYKAYLQVESDNAGLQTYYRQMLPFFYYRGLMTDPNAGIIVLHEPSIN